MEIIFKALKAASTPLFPCLPPDLSKDCPLSWSVNTQKITGMSSDKFSYNIPLATLLHI